MDVASEPHEFNIYTTTNFSTLTQDIAKRLSNSLCNSKRFPAIGCHYCMCLCKYVPNLRFLTVVRYAECSVMLFELHKLRYRMSFSLGLN